MSKFYNKMTSVLTESKARLVMIKNSNTRAYVIDENHGGLPVLYIVSSDQPEEVNQLMTVDPHEITDLPPETSEQQTSPLDVVKRAAVVYLSQKGLIDCSQKDKIAKLSECPCVNCVESFLRSYNITDTEIIRILKVAI